MTKQEAYDELKSKTVVSRQQQKRRQVDVLDLLPEEGLKKLDGVGYQFLSERGYDVVGAKDSEIKRVDINRAMKKNQEKLEYCGALNKETGTILVWFEIKQGGKAVARSQGIKFVSHEKKVLESGENKNGQ